MGGEKQVTIMVLKVDLQCCKCYKKIKKILCKIPQIQDQIYDEKNNTVIIKVVCCSPEKIKEKIICRGGCTIQSIEIKVPEKPKPKPPPPAEKPPPPVEKPPPPVEKPLPPPERPEAPERPRPGRAEDPENPDEPARPRDKEPARSKAPEKPKPPPKHLCPPVPVCPPPLGCIPIGVCCQECYSGRPGVPCFHGHGGPPPWYQYDGYCGRPVFDSWGGGRNCYGSRCDTYFCEENPQGCTIM